jgi:hypothetical protein
VVVPSARAMSRGSGRDWGLSLYTPVIVSTATRKPTGLCGWKSCCGKREASVTRL